MTPEQKAILQIGSFLGAGAVLFPPFQRLTYGGGYVGSGFHFIAQVSDNEQVHVGLLALILMTIASLTAVAYFTNKGSSQ